MSFLSISTNRQSKKEMVREILKIGLMFALSFYKILTFDLVFPYSFMFFMFWKERDIKWEQNYIFSPIFNISELQNFN